MPHNKNIAQAETPEQRAQALGLGVPLQQSGGLGRRIGACILSDGPWPFAMAFSTWLIAQAHWPIFPWRIDPVDWIDLWPCGLVAFSTRGLLEKRPDLQPVAVVGLALFSGEGKVSPLSA